MKAGRVALVAAFALAAAYFAYRLGRKLQYGPLVERNGIDFSINWTAARAARDGTSLYADASLRALSIRHIGAWTAPLYTSTFTSYLGPPSTALLHLPYTWLPFGVALVIHRFESGLLFAASVFIAGLALPKESRLWGWLVGSLALLTFQGIVVSLAVGQIDAWVMLGLAIAFYGIRTRRWGLVGIGIGVAATLKVTPILLLAYLVLRRQWRAAFAGGVTCIALVGAGTSIAGFSDLRTFVTDVAPKLGEGSIDTQNQSLPAYAARVLGGDTNFLDLQAGIGAYRYLGLVGAAALILTIAWRRRTHPFVPLEIGLVLLVSLVFAPITWDHSATWAILVLVLLADRRLWPQGVWVVVMLRRGRRTHGHSNSLLHGRPDPEPLVAAIRDRNDGARPVVMARGDVDPPRSSRRSLRSRYSSRGATAGPDWIDQRALRTSDFDLRSQGSRGSPAARRSTPRGQGLAAPGQGAKLMETESTE